MAVRAQSASIWLAVTVLLSGGAVACGGTQGSEADGTQGSGGAEALDPTSCSVVDAYEFEAENTLIDFEDGRAPGFYADNDGTEGSTATPNASAPVTPERIVDDNGDPAPRCETSERALHLTATGLQGWGAVVGLNFQPSAFDASEWDGISFWAKRGPGDVGRSFFAAVTEWHTSEADGYCNTSTAVSDLCDRFGIGIGVDTTWRFFAVPFSAMGQQGYGKVAECLYTSEIIGLGFYMSSGDWDVWIDDIAFYRGPEGDRPEPVECADAPTL